MTGILIGCVVLILAVGALYALLCHEPHVAKVYYRLFPGQYAKALAEAEDVWYPTDVAEADARDLYPAEAADAPDPVDEHFSTAPRVVAGQDLDDSLLIAEWQQAYADYRAGVDIFAGARHEPSPEVRK